MRALTGITLTADMVMLIAVGVANAFSLKLHEAGPERGAGLLANLAAIVVAVTILHRQSPTNPRKLADLRSQVIPILISTSFAGLVSSFCLILNETSFRHVAEWCTAWITGSVILLTISRALLTRLVQGWRDSGRLDYKIAIIGSARAAQGIVRRTSLEERVPVRVVGFYAWRSTCSSATETQVDSLAFRGDLDVLILDIRLRKIDAVLIVRDELPVSEAAEIITWLEHYAADMYILLSVDDLLPSNEQSKLSGNLPIINVKKAPLHGWQGLIKTGFDKLIAATLLIMLLPVLGIVAVLIRMDSPGPILFRQIRTGYNNTLFSMLKFRTMYHHMADRQAAAQTVQGDNRVTSVGRILRKLSIDELPQLVNVLRGDMSLVGPRPHAPGTAVNGVRVDDLVAGYARRHRVRPGLTGLAQVNGSRGCMTTPEHASQRLQYDIEYIENWSFWLDIKIVILTVLREVVSRHAF